MAIALSINRIKQMKSWFEPIVLDFMKQAPFYITFIGFVFDAAIEDPELYEELKRLEQKYNHIRDDLIRSWENNDQNQSQNQNQTQNRNQENRHYYTYFECRHSDDIIYEKQKGKRKSNPDGWKYCCTLKPSGLAKMTLKHENFWLYKVLLGSMSDDTLDENRSTRRFVDLCNLLFDMGWPKSTVLEKLYADIFKSDLIIGYEQKGLKPDSPEFDKKLDEALHKFFRSDRFRQMKLNLSLD
jgi:hypothetical protein